MREILEFQQNGEVEVSKHFDFEEASFDNSSALFHFSRSQEPSYMTTSKAPLTGTNIITHSYFTLLHR